MSDEHCFQRPQRLAPDLFIPDFQDPFFQSMLSEPAAEACDNRFSFGPADQIASLFSPLPVSLFQTRYWEQQLFHQRGQEPDFYSLKAFEQDLLQAPFQALRLSLQGKPVDLNAHLQGASYAQALQRLYHAEGVSFRILSLQQVSAAPQLQAQIQAFQSWTRCPIKAVAFYSAAGESVIPIHWDTENLFIQQISGCKTWEITPTDFAQPLHFQKSDSYLPQLNPLTDQQVTLTLLPGDLLYVPRGFLHRARAAEEPSLHVTFGVFSPTWFDLVMYLLDAALLRSSHQPGLKGLINAPELAADPEKLQHLLAEVLQNVDLNAVRHFFSAYQRS